MLLGCLAAVAAVFLGIAAACLADTVVVSADRMIDVVAGRIVTSGPSWALPMPEKPSRRALPPFATWARITSTTSPAVGLYGDLIAMAGDPIVDVTLLQSVAFVMKGGEVVKAPPR